MKRFLPLLVPVLLAGCGTLPQPFLGRPGPEGALLSVPPPPVLIVAPSRNAMLGNGAAHAYAVDLADALVARDVPSVVRPAGKLDWRLVTSAQIADASVIPYFSIVGPTGRVYGHSAGAPVSEQAWSDADPATLQASAAGAAPELVSQLKAINASVQQSNPLSLENRPPRVMFEGVSGAPGDGDHALGLDLKRDLPQLGVVIVKHKSDADFLIQGQVKVSPNHASPSAAPGDLVELDWIVRGQGGQFIGKVSQLHDLGPDQIDHYWGDVAVAAAQQAALGLKQVIINATLKPTPVAGSPAGHPGSAIPARPPAP